jgi:hypothetical protein
VKGLNKNAVIIKLNELQQRHKKELRVYRPKAVGPLTSKNKSNPSYTPMTEVTTVSTVWDVMNGIA